jgi:DNA processing protein
MTTIVARTPADILGTLNEIEARNAPTHLYLAGDVSLLSQGPRISIVGSRAASAEGLRRARVLANALADRGIIVVSGLAKGVDRAAHEAAIEAGGRTIAVIGTPLDTTYPTEHADLQARLMAHHLVISQFASGTPTTRRSFPMRNRTMALLTDATVIVEAGEKSGALYQGWEALRLGRLVFLLDSVARNNRLSWPQEMIRYGAQVLSRENLPNVIDTIPSMTVSSASVLEA